MVDIGKQFHSCGRRAVTLKAIDKFSELRLRELGIEIRRVGNLARQ